ncbi:MAG: nitroreductase/quinone reductase family protein [Dehalococcoidia bacterium]
MDPEVKRALEHDITIDITTRGRKMGQPRRAEMWFHHLDDRIYITGAPGRRDWLANLIADPEFTFHLKHSAQADLPAKARPIFDQTERRQILTRLVDRLGGGRDVEKYVKDSPLIEVDLLD